MQFTSKFTGILLALAASANASFNRRSESAEVSVVLFDDVNFSGASYSPQKLVPAVCKTLPGSWLDRAESVVVGDGYQCLFFTFSGCEGPGTQIIGSVSELYDPLYNSVESFLCTKLVL